MDEVQDIEKAVGMTGFEPATTRPPDVYSNRTELHPENCGTKILIFVEIMECGEEKERLSRDSDSASW